MRRLTRGRVALACVLVVLAMQMIVVSPARAVTSGNLTTSAGAVAAGTASALGMAARGLAINSTGTVLYVADSLAHAIRRIDLSTGEATVLAGMGAGTNGGDGGPATVAGLNNPVDVDVDANGDVYIAAQSNARIRKVTVPGGTMSTVYGAVLGQLNNPQGVAFSPGPAGDMFIADTYNGRVLRVTTGGVMSIFATGLNRPSNIAFDSAGRVFVSDCQAHQILRYDAAGGSKTVVAGFGTGLSGPATDGVAATASGVNCPRGMAVDPSDVVYFADSANHRIRRFTVGGVITTVAGTGTPGLTGDGGAATSANIDQPTDVVRDPVSGTFYFAQGETQSIATWGVRKFTVGGTVSAVAGNRWATYSGDGGAVTNAQIYRPGGVAFDSSDAMYIADSGNNRIRKSVAGMISTIAGDGTPGSGAAGDGGAATSANLADPQDVLVAGNGDVYISDTGHHRIRKVAGGIISNVAGTGTASYSTGTAATSHLNSPYGIDIAANGDIYVADTGNNMIRVISGTTITTIAGTGVAGYNGDGAAVSATLNAPRDVRVDASGDIYIADTGNRRVRRIRGGVITTVAGTGAAGVNTASGDGGLATAAAMDVPAGLEYDADGNLYIADGNLNVNNTSSHVVRRVDKHGIIHTVAGRTGSYSFAGDGGSGTASGARLHTPARLAFDSIGNLHIAAAGELRIRALTTENSAAFFWTSNATTGGTGAVYGWEFVSRTATPIASITITIPSAAAGTVAGLYLAGGVHLPTTGTLSRSGSTLTYTLSTPVTVPAGRHMYLSVAGFTNQATSNWYTSTITTLASGGAAIDVAQSGAVFFTNAAPVLVVPDPNSTVTAPAQTVVYVDPLTGSDSTVVLTATVRSNATNGYSLRMAGTPVTGIYGALTPVSGGLAGQVAGAAFGTNRFGYNVAVNGTGVSTGTSGSYSGYVGGGEVVATAGKPTSVNGDTVQVTNRIKVDYLQKAGVYTGTMTFQLTAAY